MKTRGEVARRLEALRDEIRRHDRLYYALAKPEISDQDYDRLYEELRTLEAEHPDLVTPDSPTQRVGGAPSEEFPTFTHRVPMLSLDNTYSEEELKEFEARIFRLVGERELDYVAELKIDGLSMALHYEGGRLLRGVTRGDGVRGDDVTANLKAIKAVPLALSGDDVPGELEVRGEVYLPRSRFEAINREREEKEEELYANPRNVGRGDHEEPGPAHRGRPRAGDLPVLDRALQGRVPSAGAVGGPGAHAVLGAPHQPGLAPLPRPRSRCSPSATSGGTRGTPSSTRSTAWS